MTVAAERPWGMGRHLLDDLLVITLRNVNAIVAIDLDASADVPQPLESLGVSDLPLPTARKRANARCWCGPALRPNQPSFVRLTSMSGRGLVRAR